MAARTIDSPYAWFRLGLSILLSTIGGVGMWSVVVALPAVQAKFGVARGGASLPFTLTMLGFGVGGVLLGRLADTAGILVPVRGGLVTYYVLFFIHLGSRKGHVAGVTPHPNEVWMEQVARNVTMEEWGGLSPSQYLIHDRDSKFCAAFQQIIDDAGVARVVLPPRSPNLNAYAERWIRSVTAEALSRMILFGEASLRHVLNEYMDHYHQERNHQGKGHGLLFPQPRPKGRHDGPIQDRERLGGLCKYYARKAA